MNSPLVTGSSGMVRPLFLDPQQFHLRLAALPLSDVQLLDLAQKDFLRIARLEPFGALLTGGFKLPPVCLL